MKALKFLLLVVFGVVLVGCVEPQGQKDDTKKPEEVVLTGHGIAYVDESYEIELPVEFDALKAAETVWTNENELVAVLQEGGVLFAYDAGTTVVTVRNGHVTYRLTLDLYKRNDVNQELESIIRTIRQMTTLEGKSSLELVTSLPDYEFEVSYVSPNPDLLDVDGSFTRGLRDQYVNLEATIAYKGVVRVFPVPVKIPMIDAAEQQQTIESFLKERLDAVIATESGQLPTMIDVYELKVKWRSAQPGVIDSNNGFHPTYNAVENTIIAEFVIGTKEYEMKVKYNSKGITEQEKEAYIQRVFADLIPEQAGTGLSLIYGNKVDVIQDIVYPDTVKQLRPGTGKNGQKMPGGPQYVVIHDTGMTGENDNADGLSRYIHSQANSVDGRVASWHFSIDDTKAYQHVPTDEIAWHAGDGSAAFNENYDRSNITAIGGGNRNGIGIETCINPDNDYALTLKRTANLTAQLLHQYGLDLDRIKQHYNFSGKICPQVIRNSGWMWDVFLKDVEIEYFLMMIGDDIKAEWNISHPEAVFANGLTGNPIQDTSVDLTLKLTVDGVEREFEYTTLVKGMNFDQKVSKIYMRLLLEELPSSTDRDIVLPTEYEDYQAVITWKSSHPDILDETGKYTKPSSATNVKLTATIEIDGKTIERGFGINVK